METKQATTSQRVRTEVLSRVTEFVKDKGVSPIRFMENSVLQRMSGCNPDWAYKVGDKVKGKKGNYICVCADDSTAIFAPFIKLRAGGTQTKYTGMIASSNKAMFTLNPSAYKRIN